MEGPRRFFDQTEAELRDGAVWAGELYLEHHRGTYTTQGATKQGNRRGELALRDAELWSALVDGDAPTEDLHRAWQALLLHQFHDIIPGSGIHWVYEDTREAHAGVVGDAEAVTAASLSTLTGEIDTSGTARPVVVWNSLSHGRSGLVEVDVDGRGRPGPGPRRGDDGAAAGRPGPGGVPRLGAGLRLPGLRPGRRGAVRQPAPGRSRTAPSRE